MESLELQAAFEAVVTAAPLGRRNPVAAVAEEDKSRNTMALMVAFIFIRGEEKTLFSSALGV